MFNLFKKLWCAFNSHPDCRVSSGPFNGLWTLYCPTCDKYWDEYIDGIMPRDDDTGDCPKCGYPSRGQYTKDPCLGIYFPGVPCDGCGFTDEDNDKVNIQDFTKEN